MECRSVSQDTARVLRQCGYHLRLPHEDHFSNALVLEHPHAFQVARLYERLAIGSGGVRNVWVRASEERFVSLREIMRAVREDVELLNLLDTAWCLGGFPGLEATMGLAWRGRP